MEGQTLELARSIKRVPEEDRHSADAIEQVNRRPQDMLHRAAWGAMPRQERVDRLRPAEAAEEPPQAKAKKLQNMSVTMKDLENHGYTPHCPRCDHIRAHGHARGFSQSHSHECRLRISLELEKSPEGLERLARVAARWGIDDGHNTHDEGAAGANKGSAGA